MEYLKSYKLFEFIDNTTEISDICLELTDVGFTVDISDVLYIDEYYPQGFRYLIIICNNLDKNNFYLFEETLLRIKDHLGEKYLKIYCKKNEYGYEPKDMINMLEEIEKDINNLTYYKKFYVKIRYLDNNSVYKFEDELKLKEILKRTGSTIELGENNISEIDDMLNPYKSYYPYTAIYPPIGENSLRRRSGYCWFLNKPINQYNRYEKCEVLVNKFNNDYYIINIVFNSDFTWICNFYLVHTFDKLKKLIKEKVINLCR